MKDKFVFSYDRHTKKGIIKTDKGEIKINLEKNKSTALSAPPFGSSGGEGFGLHLI